MTIKEIRSRYEQKKGMLRQLEKNIEQTKEQIELLNKSLRTHEKANVIIQQVGLKTQQQLSYNISEIASLALSSVMDEPYVIHLDFVERRNKTECDIYFVRDGIQMDPFAGGGGAIDIASFALRVASWSMQNPRTRSTLILDEPFKHLKGEETNKKMLEMVKQISKKLNIQIIMVSDERVSREATIAATDKLFETSIKNGVTKVSEI
jgi:DNA repair exonuclease SbcCD ATPase subunit